MTKTLPKLVAYVLKDESIVVGRCEEIEDISPDKRELILNEAYKILQRTRDINKPLLKKEYDSAEKKDGVRIEMNCITSAYILD